MANTNFDHLIYKAIALLLENNENMELNAFIDGGSGDLYLEATNGHRLCVARDSVTYCVDDWVYGEWTEVANEPSAPAYPLQAQALYENGCDPITAQYMATGELPG